MGRFGLKFEPEAYTKSPYSGTGSGRFDFLVDDLAIEFATRTPDCSPTKLKKSENLSEIMKVARYAGPSVIVLFDFSNCALSDDDLEQYRELPSLGQVIQKRPFSILYFYKDDKGNSNVIRKNIAIK